MLRRTVLVASLILSAMAPALGGQAISIYQTTPDLLEALSERQKMHFEKAGRDAAPTPLLTVDDSQRFQEIDGFGATLTDAAAWLLAKKLSSERSDDAFRMLFARKGGIALNILRQPLGSSDLALTFYSYDDLCQQSEQACATPPGQTDPGLAHFSLNHDREYILPALKKARAIDSELRVILTPWSPPGWMKTTGSILGSDPATHEASTLRQDAFEAFAAYLVKAIQGYQAAGVPVWALSVQSAPLTAPPDHSGMQMTPEQQTKFLGESLGPALAAAHLSPKVMVYDDGWDHPDYPRAVLADAKAGALAAGIAWHHDAGDAQVMSRFHDEFPGKDQWVTEAGGAISQKGYHGNVLAEDAAGLIAALRNWSKSYVLRALATDRNHGPRVGGCDGCRGLLTIDTEGDDFKPEPDYYVLGHASRFLGAGAVRIGSDEPATEVKDVAFRNPNGTIVLYVLNAGAKAQWLRIGFHGKTADADLPAGSVTTYVWKP